MLKGTQVFACGSPLEVITEERIEAVYGVKTAVDHLLCARICGCSMGGSGRAAESGHIRCFLQL
jgi:hypothetical protein